MSLSGAIRAGRGAVELFLDAEPFHRGLRKARRTFSNFGRTLRNVGLAGIGIGAALAAPLGLFTKAAGEAQEVLNRFRQTFGDLSPAAEEWVEVMRASVGRGRTELRGALSDMQALLVGFGLTRESADGFSKTMTKAAIDLASFNDVADQIAIGRVRSALSGEAEGMKKFGILTTDAAVETFLLAKGIDKSVRNMNELDKVLVRMALIKEAMVGIGIENDAVRTAESFNNQIKRMQGFFQDIKESIGTQLRDALTPVLIRFNALLEVTSDLTDKYGRFVPMIAGGVAAFIGVSAAVFSAGLAMQGFAIILGGMGAAVSGLVAGIGLLISPLGIAMAIIGAFTAWWIAWSGTASKAIASVVTNFTRMTAGLSDSWNAIKQLIQAGDLTMAMNLVTKNVQLAWLLMVDIMSTAWEGLVRNVAVGFSKLLPLIAAWVAGMKEGEAHLNRQFGEGFIKFDLPDIDALNEKLNDLIKFGPEGKDRQSAIEDLQGDIAFASAQGSVKAAEMVADAAKEAAEAAAKAALEAKELEEKPLGDVTPVEEAIKQVGSAFASFSALEAGSRRFNSPIDKVAANTAGILTQAEKMTLGIDKLVAKPGLAFN